MKVLLASAIFLSSFAFADNHEGGEGLRVGALYHYNITMDDNKHTGGDNAKSTMDHNLALGLTFKGQFNDDVSFSSMYIPLKDLMAETFYVGCDDRLTGLIWAHATLKMHEMFSLRAGCMHMNAGGFYGRNRGVLNTMQDNPAQGMVNPIRRWDKALEFRLTNENVGLVTLQLTNDRAITTLGANANPESKVVRTNRAVEDTPTGIALLAQWEAKFMDEMLHPLAQFGMYDNMKAIR